MYKNSNYYAPLIRQWACAESIRTKYRLFRYRSKLNLHAFNCYKCLKIEHLFTEFVDKYSNCSRNHSNVHHFKMNYDEHRLRSNRTNRYLSNKHSTHHTLNTSINFINNNLELIIFKKLSTLLVYLGWFMDFTYMIEFLATLKKFTEILASNLIKSFFAMFYIFNFNNLILFTSLFIFFELNDLFLIFLKNFHSFILFYIFIFTLPLSMSYLLQYQSQISEINKLTRIKELKANYIDYKQHYQNQINYQNQHIQNNLIQVNKIISLSLLCLIDYALIRNNLRIYSNARIDQLSFVYLIESFVDNIVNYDQPKFNYLPEEENLSSNKLNLINYLILFNLIRFIYNLNQLLFMDNLTFLFNQKFRSFFLKNNEFTEHQNDLKNQFKLIQTDLHLICGHNLMIIKTLPSSRFEFVFNSIKPILFGLLSYNILFIDNVSCYPLIADLIILILFICLLMNFLINLDQTDLITSSKLMNKSLKFLIKKNIHFRIIKHNETDLFKDAIEKQKKDLPIKLETQINKFTIRFFHHLILQYLFDLIFNLSLFIITGNSNFNSFVICFQFIFLFFNLRTKFSTFFLLKLNCIKNKN